MLKHIKPEDILFIDIETVPAKEQFEDLPVRMQELWTKKTKFLRKNDEEPSEFYPRAGIYAEFGKIICISAGILFEENGVRKMKIRSYAGEDEQELLMNFRNMLSEYASKRRIELCAHNGKEFDFPYIARRLLINGIQLPDSLDVAGKKPWEVPFIDTLELWRFGDYKQYTSLNLLTQIFNIPTPKDDIDGSMVFEVYYKEKDLPRIIRYCEKDVLALAQLLMRYKGEPLVDNANVHFSDI